MRTLRLARVAAEAEGLLLRRQMRRVVISALLACAATLFLAAALAMAHAAFWFHFAPAWGPVDAALVLFGIDVVIAAILGLLATRTPPDRIVEQARTVRDQALREMRSAFTLSTLLRPLVGLVLEQWLARRSAHRSRQPE
jgi:hypothetical protein